MRDRRRRFRRRACARIPARIFRRPSRTRNCSPPLPSESSDSTATKCRSCRSASVWWAWSTIVSKRFVSPPVCPFLNGKQLGRDLSRRDRRRLRAGARCPRPMPCGVRLRRGQRAGQFRRARHVHRHRPGRNGQQHLSHRPQRIRRRNGAHSRSSPTAACAAAAAADASKPWPANGP